MLRRGGLVLLMAAGVAGCALPPDGVTREDLDAYNAAVASVGCTMETESQFLPVELQTGFSRDLLLEIGRYRLKREQAEVLENGGWRLLDGACAS